MSEIEDEAPASSVIKVNVNGFHLPRSATGPERKDAEIAHMWVTGNDAFEWQITPQTVRVRPILHVLPILRRVAANQLRKAFGVVDFFETIEDSVVDHSWPSSLIRKVIVHVNRCRASDE